MTEEIAAPGEGPVSATGGPDVASGSPTFVESFTPNGVGIRYTWAPKRKYELHAMGGQSDYGEGWFEVPSVTTVLDCLNKPGLTYWGNKVGTTGVLELVKRGLLVWKHDE